MAVAVVLEFEDGTLDQYDQVDGVDGFPPGGPGPPGSLFHWVTATDFGIRVTDVWESPRAVRAVRPSEQIGPKTAEAGVPEAA